ncbi:MAG: hypothetical protein KatS3mg087_1024 [Patescibacteria group bacterium]|nr:MAG: hypothetical protein KatS3mg087_1024 [Patescibacteria group bacterium]
MPAVVTADNVRDLVAATLRDLGRMKFEQIAQELQRYEVFSKWFKEDKVQLDSGIGIQRTLMTSLSRRAKHVGMFEETQITIPDLIKQMQIPWRFAQTHWAWEYREILMNRGEALIFNVIKPRRADAMISLAEELEEKAWSAPNVADTHLPYGIPYWVVKNNTQGFNGGLPADHTTVAGIDLNAVPTFKNWTDSYTVVSKSDLISKMRKAKRKTNFISPVTIDDYTQGTGEQYRIYVNDETMTELENVGESQNENLGRDLAYMFNNLVFRNHPVIYLPILDSDTDNPVYGIDHSKFYPVCLQGDYLRESEPLQDARQHNVYQVFVDLTYNYVCVDRRRQWVIKKA